MLKFHNIKYTLFILILIISYKLITNTDFDFISKLESAKILIKTDNIFNNILKIKTSLNIKSNYNILIIMFVPNLNCKILQFDVYENKKLLLSNVSIEYNKFANREYLYFNLINLNIQNKEKILVKTNPVMLLTKKV